MLPDKILHVVSVADSLPFLVGDQLDYFNIKGVRFYLACSGGNDLIKFSKNKNAIPLNVEINRRISILKDLKAILKLLRFIKKNHINLVFGHTPKGSLIAMIAAYFAGVQFRVYVRHGLLYESAHGLRYYLYKNIERLTGFLATRVVCVSKSVLEVSERDRLSKTQKHVLLNMGSFNGIDAIHSFNRANISPQDIVNSKSRLKIEEDNFIFGFIGRLVNDKGVKELVLAWKILLKNNIKAKLLIIGPFEIRDQLDREIIDYLNNEPSIILIGETYPVNLYYSLMNVFILPSYREGLPTVVLEASAMELPVITTKSTGCKDSIIEDLTGIFCTLDPLDISEKMMVYYYDRILAKAHGSNGREFVLNNFNQEVVWKELEEKVLKTCV